MPVDRESHFNQHVEDSDLVVLRKDEFDQLVDRSGPINIDPQHLVDRNGAVTHVVLHQDEYEYLLNESPDPDDIFRIHMPRKDVHAEAVVSADPNDFWIYVYKGSTIGKIEDSLESHYRDIRKELWEQGITSDYEGPGRFLKNRSFDDPSTAARVVAGSPQDGNLYWKDRLGRTLADRGLQRR